LENPRHITSADRGPAIDPAALVATPYDGFTVFGTLRSFMSSSYAISEVWVYAADDEPGLYDTQVAYTYPDFYKPTWGEVFDHLAYQIRGRWEWNPQNRQFKFSRSDLAPLFSVTLEPGWRREDRGLYVWHAPKDQPMGMDIYYFGHFTGDAALYKKVRENFAFSLISKWPTPPTIDDMKPEKVAGAEALYLRADTPRPGGLWRQWSFVLNGHAFLIVSAGPKETEAQIGTQVDRMVKSFQMREVAATQPATKPGAQAPTRSPN
jgi:hypothetical protein